ncbi:hypothetical protein [Actinophytocola sp.]|uniref:hypothetical protein n=1 Tax=Actinophytocola sp. TaxID=1872138 RepID=UPI003D6A17BC
MSHRAHHAITRQRVRTLLTVDTGSTGALSPRFLTLVVRPCHQQARPAQQGAEAPARYPDLPAAN